LHERNILEALILDISKVRFIPKSISIACSVSSHWSPPHQGFLKLNFDGASKGNPSVVGYGGIFIDETSHILGTYTIKLGTNNNNIVEIKNLEEGLHISLREHYTKLVVEGYYQLIINMLSHLQEGSPLQKF
jgi:ribonuclease HI